MDHCAVGLRQAGGQAGGRQAGMRARPDGPMQPITRLVHGRPRAATPHDLASSKLQRTMSASSDPLHAMEAVLHSNRPTKLGQGRRDGHACACEANTCMACCWPTLVCGRTVASLTCVHACSAGHSPLAWPGTAAQPCQPSGNPAHSASSYDRAHVLSDHAHHPRTSAWHASSVACARHA